MTRRHSDGSVQHYTYHRVAKRRLFAPYGTAAFDAEYRAIQEDLVPRPRPTRRTFIYAVRAMTTGHIKIGKAGQPTQRMRELQTACPDELQLLGVLIDPTGGLLERVLHQRFDASRLRPRAEWFRATEDLLAWIARETSATECEAIERFDKKLEA